MSKKALVINLVAHRCFIRHLEEEKLPQNELLFSAISNTYLPLLNMFANLEAEGIPFKVNMVVTPTLATMLADPVIQQQYIEWENKLISLGQAELGRYQKDSVQYKLAERYLNNEIKNLKDFQETFNQDILSKISYYADKGCIELMATAATCAFFPHYMDIPEALQAQIETGLQVHKKYFGLAPEGFWIPYMSYAPGIEHLIRPYGFSYSILDTHGILFATPKPEAGIFAPVRCRNSLAFFGRTNEDLNLFRGKKIYRNQDRDLGFEAERDYLENALGKTVSRFSTCYRYWSGNTSDDAWYDIDAAMEQAEADADAFIAEKKEKLCAAEKACGDRTLSMVSCFDINIFGTLWYEGIYFLEKVFRKLAEQDDITLSTCSELVDKQTNLQRVAPFPCATNGAGYGEDLIDISNAWMLRYVRKAADRMVDLTSRFTDDTGLKARTLNLAAKEVLLAMSGDWPRMLHDGEMPDYAEERFKESISAFTTVYDSLGSNSISTEWLTRIEKEHTLFPEMNYHVFSTKK